MKTLLRSLFLIYSSSSLLLVCACGPSSEPSTEERVETKPSLTVRSAYYTPKVDAELKSAGLLPSDFKQGQQFYELYCMSCHTAPKMDGGPDPDKRLAPPPFAVSDHYRRVYPNTRERIAAIAKNTAKPDKESALMPGAIKKFGIMAPMPLPEDQLQQIAIFLATADFKKPGWYDQHYEEEHGSN